MAQTINNEEQLQAACFQWFWNTYPEQRQMLFHVNNSPAADRIVGSRYKAIGVVKGVSDMVLVLNRACIFIEFKYGKGVQSPEQIEFMRKIESRHHLYLIVRSFDEFKFIVGGMIKKYG